MNKQFLGLPVLQSTGWQSLLKHILSILLFTAIAYFINALLVGIIVKSDTWYYIQQEQKDYVMQFVLLLFAIFIGIGYKALLNLWQPFFYHLPKFDKWFYPFAFILTYLIINEIGGL